MRKFPKDADTILKERIQKASLDLQRKQQGIATSICQERKYKLITPLFGGGVDPGVPDLERLITGKSVRGQLRFWWRAARGGEFGDDLIRLKQREGLIWGSTALEIRKDGVKESVIEPFPSQVKITISIDEKGDEDYPFEVVWRTDDRGRRKLVAQAREGSKALPYFAFPLQPDSEAVRSARCPEDVERKFVRVGIAFTLKVQFPATHRKDVEAALWAWETFGGIGARTRRGFGSVHLISYSENGGLAVQAQQPEANRDAVRKWIQDQFGKYVVNERGKDGATILAHQNLPHLSEAMLSRLKIVGPLQNEQAAWKKLADALRNFRQSRSGGGRGRSKWPEPDEIRYLTNQYLPKHEEGVFDPPIAKFPRSLFGLPIVFHFKDNDTNDPHSKDCDPVDTTLQFQDFGRWASQLILRPFLCANGQAVGIAMLLRIRSLPGGGFVLIPKNFDGEITGPEPVNAWLDQGEANDIEPLLDNKGIGQINPVFAFLNTLE